MTPARADATRNRQRLLDAALAAFSSDEDVSLDAIARAAGVGIGTLYRHFPSREALVEAVYRNELERLCRRPPAMLRRAAPDVALRRWMGAYLDFVSTKRGMADAMRLVIDSGAVTRTQTRETLALAIAQFLDAGAAAGVLRDDARADDVTAALTGVTLACTTPRSRTQAGRLLDLLVDGLRRPDSAR